ncbi:leukocyte surface antigen CD53-like [Amphiura filiformis]|uniref:leukocyte surface antigen CD53-like n=1 Tax=Amphiura filiformis TaxID=82378 RepID=UPI003B226397
MSCLKFVRVLLFLQNFIFWIIGLVLIGIASYILLAKDLSVQLQFLEGTHLICYVCIGVGVVLFVIGLIGCCGAFKEIKCLLIVYAGVLVLLLLVEITAGFYIGHQYDQFVSYMAKAWYHLDETTINTIQSQFKCCGFNASEEYKGDEPSSCYDPTTSVLYDASCYSKLVRVVADNISVSTSIGAVIGALEVCGVIFTAYILYKKRSSRNQTKVVPLKNPDRRTAWETA